MFSNLTKETRVGLLITLIVHLVIAIVLLSAVVTPKLKGELDIVIDYSEMEELEKLQKELELKKSVNEKLKSLLGENFQPIRNVAVDGNSQLKDAKGIDAEKLYRDAERVQKEFEEIQNRKQELDPEMDDSPARKDSGKQETKKDEAYSGPAVVKYFLVGRKATYIPSPAYRCYGAGEVVVQIGVTTNGDVDYTRILEDQSSDDTCLREFALTTAKRTRFNRNTSSPAREYGTISYTFIAQ